MALALHIYVGRTVAQRTPARLDASARGGGFWLGRETLYSVAARLRRARLSGAATNAVEVQACVALVAECECGSDQGRMP